MTLEEERVVENGAVLPDIFVDLDGTLVHTDTLYEQYLALMKQRTFSALKALNWLGAGKASFKFHVAQQVKQDVTTLPYCQPLLDDLASAKKKGHRLILATGATQAIANGVATHLALFDQVLASDQTTNLIGANKLERIQATKQSDSFHYVGDSHSDLPIFEHATRIALVNPGKRLIHKCKAMPVEKVYQTKSNTMRALLKAIRPHQWTKNLLLFVPLLTAHAWRDPGNLIKAGFAFLAFCAMASATYLINDLLDLEADRHHPYKKERPFASATLSIQTGVLTVPLLFAAGIAMGYPLGIPFLSVLLLYFFTSQLYSLVLKALPLLDVTALAGLFTLRVFSGAYAVDVPISHWLLAFSMFVFFSLAFVKRYAELHNLRLRGGEVTRGRGYRVGDIDQLALFGVVSGFMSVLVLSLYLASPEVEALYSKPHLLWLICPAFFLWINWVWMTAKRGKMHEDPILFAFKDPASYLAGIWVLASVFISL